ncbi:capsular polysaccharide biosynthesis protein [Clostridium gelidum]|uniref:Capsular polysaccharide biosynthesis protein n=1 Tax=Clostridium gelidum TaxID=704125 RepID=A0ABM7T7R6_9CLOT|nr:Wzz/FepE/Etk N-terminal domain-containing protein [Clostridium gelidum]BCZ47076.1 capsular polysaccharide biosynthesis protein [Clostridium gelidum]
MNEEIINFEKLAGILIKRWKLICMITLTATIFSIIISFFIIIPKYQTSTKVFIGKEDSKTQDKDKNYNGNDVDMYQKLLKTYAEVIQTTDLIEKAVDVERLGLKSQDILKNLKVTPTTDTQILQIEYTNTDRVLARNILDSVTNEFVAESTELIANGNVKIIERVKIPVNPISPNKKINITIAFLLGFIISTILSFLLESIDNTFKNKEQMEAELRLPVLGVIPDFLKQ